MLKRIIPYNYKQVNGLLLVDNDGTFIPGTETRNRIALQRIVDEFATAGGVSDYQIPWDYCNGRAECDIHEILTQKGFPNLGQFITADEFTARAKQGYDAIEPDYTPRENMIDTLMGLQDVGIWSVLVSNSEKPAIDKCMREAFKESAHNAEDVFPIIVTKTDVLAAGKATKPSADPFYMAVSQFENLFRTQVPKSQIAIIEDSGTGVVAGKNFHGNGKRTIQFKDMATPHPDAKHHVLDMTGCLEAIKSCIDVPTREGQTAAVLETLARNP